MSIPEGKTASARHYYVDESGDGVIFNRKGHVILGTPGCSNHFILGMLDVANPKAVAGALGRLRDGLVADPYFKDVPSMQPGARKTALFFHAKNDVPEVRREVFKLLLEQDVRFYAVIKDMHRVLEYVRSRNSMHPEHRYHPNELYDLTVRMLFKNRLHQHAAYTIVFARRGASDRTRAMAGEIMTARNRFRRQWGITRTSSIKIVPRYAHQEAGLQAADYFLWAVHRLYEAGEDRYATMMWPRIALVHDVDDTRQASYGMYYNRKRPLTRAAIRPRRV